MREGRGTKAGSGRQGGGVIDDPNNVYTYE
jgi:hypothetical protein